MLNQTPTPAFTGETSLRYILSGLVRNPYRNIIQRWNWKSAMFSAIARAIVFFMVNLSAGLDAALSAMFVDIAFRISTAGFYGGLTQTLKRAEPAWQGAVASMIILPLCNHSVEFLVHWSHGTARLQNSIAVSVCLTALSTLFTWYAMRKGALLVAGEGDSLGRDMLRMPRIIAGFVAAAPLALWRLAFNRQ
jgi:hypothetical protein